MVVLHAVYPMSPVHAGTLLCKSIVSPYSCETMVVLHAVYPMSPVHAGTLPCKSIVSPDS